jgi:hypothetical protein
MNTQQNLEERLWDYMDGLSAPTEKSIIDRLLETDAEWQAKYAELLEIRDMISASELEQPSLRFTKDVMEEIARLHIAPATTKYINKRIVWGIGIFFITVLVAFLVYGFGQVEWSTQGDTALPIDFSKVDYSKIFNNTFVNIFMMINIVLGLFLLDRYLAGKRKKFREDI